MLELAVTMTLWGTLGIFVLWSGLSAIDIAFYRCLIGAIATGCWLIKSKQKIEINKTTSVIAIAGCFLILNWVLLFKSFQLSSITVGNISYYLQPILLIILGILFYNEKVSLKKWMLIFTAFTGVVLTIGIFDLQSQHLIYGAFLALLAAFFYSLLTLLMKNVEHNSFKVVFIQLSIGVLILLPFVHFHHLSMITIACLLVIGLIHTLGAYYLYYKALKKTNFTQIAIFSYLDPIVAILTDILFFNRTLDIYQSFGIVLTFTSLFMLIKASRETTIDESN